MFSTRQLAVHAGVNVETLRFYERKDLMPAPQRTSGGYRQYSESDLQRLKFILTAKRHGFTLQEIKELLDLRVSSENTCEQVQAIAREKIKLIDEKLRELKRIKKALQILSQRCQSEHPTEECPILQAFEKHE